MPIIEVKGLASKTSHFLDFDETDLEKDLLSWLRTKKMTIASSCDGQGICKNCSIQNGWLTCQLTLKEFLERQPDGKIEISYL
jgi:hypothetical protein